MNTKYDMIKYVHGCVTQHARNQEIETTKNWYSHIPKSATEHEDVTVLWNQGIQTNRDVLANRPDIIVKSKDRTCLLIDVAISSDRNVIQKEAGKK
jgi:hypothetical protein